MERKIEKTLSEWKRSTHRLPLVLRGARQVGKTYTLLAFGKKQYQSVHYFNFEGSRELAGIFERDLNTERILRELSIYGGTNILAGESLIIFDEIQACERALTSLKYFAEQAPAYHVAAAGSLLGVAINREKYSFPVGKVWMLAMYPLDFEEFLWAIGQKNASIMIREAFERNVPVSLHSTFLDYYRQYLFLGGMPQVIQEFIGHRQFELIPVIQKNIENAFIADMAKYAGKEETVRIMSSYQSIPAQLAKENKKFQYRFINKGARSSQYATSLDWLRSSGIVFFCYKVTEGKFPLTAFTDASAFKIYMADTGLLCASYGMPAHLLLSESVMTHATKGILCENFVAASLVYNGHVPYYWESQGKAEVDFVIQNTGGQVIPLEVKSSEHVRSRSLQQYVLRYKPPYSVRISTRNFGFENQIKSVPVYAVYCM